MACLTVHVTCNYGAFTVSFKVMYTMFCIRSYVSMEEHLESCESRLQEMIPGVEMLKKQVCITSDCQYKPVRTYVHVCMLITHLVNSMTKYVAYYVLQ